MKNFVAIVICAIGTVGCASSTFTYTNPHTYQVETERVVPVAFNKFWDMYVAELSKSFFVINNIEKESRIINVSFSSDTPSVYIDCGRSNRTSTYGADKQSYDYAVADSSSYQMGVAATNHLWFFNRNTTLDGRINIFMAPEGSQTLLR